MHVRLKGINSVTSGSPMAASGPIGMRGKAGLRSAANPERQNSSPVYQAVARKVVPPRGTLLSVMQAYQLSGEFLGLADVTRKGYIWHIKRIEKEFHDFPLSGLTDRRTRGIFMAWRDRVATSSGLRLADYSWMVLARILSWGLDRGLVLANPCTRGGRLH